MLYPHYITKIEILPAITKKDLVGKYTTNRRIITDNVRNL